MIAADRALNRMHPGTEPLTESGSKLAYLRPRTADAIATGQCLLEAGLIAELELAAALRQYQMDRQSALEDILVERGAISRQTADFFIHQLPELERTQHLLSVGELTVAAGLLRRSTGTRSAQLSAPPSPRALWRNCH